MDYSEISSVFPFTSKQVCPHLTNVQLGHVTHAGQFLLLVGLLLRDLAQFEISSVLTCLGMFFLASIVTLKGVLSTRRCETHGPPQCVVCSQNQE